MKKNISKIKYDNQSIPGFEFEIISLEELYKKKLDHSLMLPQQLEFYLLLLITEGRSYHLVDFIKYPYRRGTIFTIGKNQVQQFSADRKYKGFIVLFTEDFINKFFDKKETFKSLLLFNDALVKPVCQLSKIKFDDILAIIISLNDEYNNSYKDQFKEGILRSGLHALLLKIERYKLSNHHAPGKHYDEFIHFKNMVQTNCFTSREVQYYASALGFSAKKLNYIVQSFINKSAKEFIHEIFILEVKRMYINTNLSTKEIAYKCGFDEPTNLTKYFKKYSGQLPSKFKLAHQ